MLKKDTSFIIVLNMIKNLPILVILLIILGLSIYTVYELKGIQKPEGLAEGALEPLKAKLDSHSELLNYKSQYPRVSYLTDAFLQQAKTNNLVFFDKAKQGDYLLEYAEAAVIYDSKEDKIVNVQEVELAPADLLDKITANQALSGYKGVTPRLVIKVNKDNLENLKQQISGLNESFIGDYIVNYDDRVVIFDYESGNIVYDIPLQAQLPADFFTKLLVHPEVKGYENEKPNGRVLDQANLDQLKQTYPTLYKNAEAGDIVLQYSNLLVIYNYQNDQIKDTFNLQ